MESQVVFTGKCNVELAEIPADTRDLGPREVKGRTLATIISAGTELAVYHGLAGGHFPVHPGYAAVFQVDEIGPEVTRFRTGDIAFCMGPHRSFQRTSEESAVPVPSGLPPEKAVFGRMMAVSMSTLTTTTARPPAKVLVTGLGLVGHLAAQVFTSCGYDVTATDPVETRRKTAENMGIVNAREALPEETVGRVSLVVECSGHEQAVLDACKAVRKRSEVVLVGVPWKKRTDLSAFEILHAVFHKYVVLRSGWEWEVPVQEAEFRTNSILGNIEAAMAWIIAGRVRVDGLYRIEPPAGVAEAFSSLAAGTCERLGVVLNWHGPRRPAADTVVWTAPPSP